jgi:hypothetical protein
VQRTKLDYLELGLSTQHDKNINILSIRFTSFFASHLVGLDALPHRHIHAPPFIGM